eukprot:RCo050231
MYGDGQRFRGSLPEPRVPARPRPKPTSVQPRVAGPPKFLPRLKPSEPAPLPSKPDWAPPSSLDTEALWKQKMNQWAFERRMEQLSKRDQQRRQFAGAVHGPRVSEARDSEPLAHRPRPMPRPRPSDAAVSDPRAAGRFLPPLPSQPNLARAAGPPLPPISRKPESLQSAVAAPVGESSSSSSYIGGPVVDAYRHGLRFVDLLQALQVLEAGDRESLQLQAQSQGATLAAAMEIQLAELCTRAAIRTEQVTATNFALNLMCQGLPRTSPPARRDASPVWASTSAGAAEAPEVSPSPVVPQKHSPAAYCGAAPVVRSSDGGSERRSLDPQRSLHAEVNALEDRVRARAAVELRKSAELQDELRRSADVVLQLQQEVARREAMLQELLRSGSQQPQQQEVRSPVADTGGDRIEEKVVAEVEGSVAPSVERALPRSPSPLFPTQGDAPWEGLALLWAAAETAGVVQSNGIVSLREAAETSLTAGQICVPRGLALSDGEERKDCSSLAEITPTASDGERSGGCTPREAFSEEPPG